MSHALEIRGTAVDAAAPRIVCAWCDHTLREGSLPASHGICLECSAAFYEQIGRLPRARAVPGNISASVA